MKSFVSGALATLLLIAVCAAAPLGMIPYAALPNCGDTGGNHVNANSSTGALTCGVSVPSDVVLTDQNQVFSKSQRATSQTITISTATFTPNFDTGADFQATLVHASCPCTFANPSTTPVAGQHGLIYIVQSATGADTVGTWGSQYITSGGVASLALSAGANNIDVFSYAVKDSTHIVISAGLLNVAH